MSKKKPGPGVLSERKKKKKARTRLSARKAAWEALLKRKQEHYVTFPQSEIGRTVERLLPTIITKARTSVSEMLTSNHARRTEPRWNEMAKKLGLLKARPKTAEIFAQTVAKKVVAQILIEPPVQTEVSRIVILEKLLADKEIQEFAPEIKGLETLHAKAVKDLKPIIESILLYVLEPKK
jgi:hypothetical protein